MYNSYEIAKKIKLMARQQNLSVNQLLLNCELGKNTVSKIASGTDILTLNFARIADCLNCSIDYLLGRTDDPTLHTVANTKTALTVTAAASPEASDNIVSLPKPDSDPADEQHATMLKFYSQPVSAGTGNYLDNDSPYEFISALDSPAVRAADFVVKVSGDSMEPRYYDGDKLLVKRNDDLTEGEFGVFIVNGEAFVKKFGRGELISLNPKYEPIKTSEYDEVLFAGKVISVLSDDDIL